MPDFACALYLGLRHPSERLRPWTHLTTGAPAALRRVPGAARLGGRLAALQGAEAATLVPSSLHAAWDLGGLLDPAREELHVDAGTYPVLRCAEVRAAARGVTIRRFAHHDPGALARGLGRGSRRPVVLVDGVCARCGAPVPLAGLIAAVRARDGVVVVDDTQATGILGAPDATAGPWGRGGGGSLRHHGLEGAPDVVLIASAAKALGVPVAAVSGSRAVVGRYAARADTRVQASPVSAADVRALEHALTVNRLHGDALRARLARRVERLRGGLRTVGIAVPGGPFPVQALPALPRSAVTALHGFLLRAHVSTIVVGAGPDAGRIVLLVTARHAPADVDAAVAAIARAPQLPLLRERSARRFLRVA